LAQAHGPKYFQCFDAVSFRAMPTQRQVAKTAVVFSVIGGVFVIVDLALDWFTYMRIAQFEWPEWLFVLCIFLAVFWPTFGWVALQKSKTNTLFLLFAIGNYVTAIQEVIFQMIFLVVCYALVRTHWLLERCDTPEELPDICTDEDEDKMQDLCAILESVFYNGTMVNASGAFAKVGDKSVWRTVEEACVHHAGVLSNVGVLLVVVALVTRCLAICSHCRAGYLGSELWFGWSKTTDLEEDDDETDSGDGEFDSESGSSSCDTR